MAAATVLKEFILKCDTETFLSEFWLNINWYEGFLKNKLLDISVNVGEWTKCADATYPSSSSFTRKVSSYHPSKISFPGLPSHAESHKTHIYKVIESANLQIVSIKENNSFRGIPYSDYFNVNTEWKVTSDRDKGGMGSQCSVTILLTFDFLKSTWLRGTIESNTKAELLTVYELWLTTAEDHLNGGMNRKNDILSGSIPILSPRDKEVQTNRLSGRGREIDGRIEGRETIDIASSESGNEGSVDRGKNNRSREVDREIDRDVDDTKSHTGSHTGSFTEDNRSRSEHMSNYGSDDEYQFYDCEENRRYQDNEEEEGDDEYSSRRTEGYRRGGGSYNNNIISTPEKLRIFYSGPSFHTAGMGGEGEVSSIKDMAVSVVETAFVIFEFSYWKINHIYNHDLRVLFDIEPSAVFTRIINSFIPGWHSSVLLHPDLYGPIIAVITMPQILLLSMGVTRHGCNQSSLLGNAVVVCLCLWIGLSSLYRLLAFVIAPAIEMKHCLSMTGYSFFAWNLALMLSYPLESYQEVTGLPVFLPLILLGLPSSIAQGCMFWEYTSASTLTLLPNAFPTSLQQCAGQHIRCLQRMAWMVPKLLAFIVVAGTHYQFLWYVARVFLPGKKELCELSALLNPTEYANIITQKQLRQFALKLLKSKKLIH